jgi:hypothetical protein
MRDSPTISDSGVNSSIEGRRKMRWHIHMLRGILARIEGLIDRSSITLTLNCTAIVQEESEILRL